MADVVGEITGLIPVVVSAGVVSEVFKLFETAPITDQLTPLNVNTPVESIQEMQVGVPFFSVIQTKSIQEVI